MKLAVSNIAWDAGQDGQAYGIMKQNKISGLEIAPTRVFPHQPYEECGAAKEWQEGLYESYGFSIPSMQSIWFGRQERLFGTEEERKALTAYTKKAIDFAAAIHCANLVFGCPVNRAIPEGEDWETGVRFFKEVGDYAASKGTVIGMEANPPIYHTNYINNTMAAIRLIEQVDSKGFLLNLDTGTMIQNHELAAVLEGRVHLVNHVHISEPGLRPIVERALHVELKQVLEHEKYDGYVSLEMGKVGELSVLEDRLCYIRRVFHG